MLEEIILKSYILNSFASLALAIFLQEVSSFERNV
jgi:hypothetical protein